MFHKQSDESRRNQPTERGYKRTDPRPAYQMSTRSDYREGAALSECCPCKIPLREYQVPQLLHQMPNETSHKKLEILENIAIEDPISSCDLLGIWIKDQTWKAKKIINCRHKNGVEDREHKPNPKIKKTKTKGDQIQKYHEIIKDQPQRPIPISMSSGIKIISQIRRRT